MEKALTARLLSNLLHIDYKIIFDNLTPSFTEIANDIKTVNSEAYIIYKTKENIIDFI